MRSITLNTSSVTISESLLHIDIHPFRCDGGRTVKVPNVESYVMVLPPQQPSLVINGTANLASDYHDFRQGVKVFPDVHVAVSPPGKPWKHGKN